MTKITRDTPNSATQFVESEQTRRNNLQALCELAAGVVSTEGQGTWTAANTLTISDTRVTSSSRILLCGADTKDPVGMWYVSSKSSGSFVITSTEVEQAGCIVNYLVINL